ncbi:MAG: formylglycine-generating enzyme family protein [Deltaproteobacteria bacterium]|nr:formylglycine-generating enzyme family protein [Deltaproteobacteria bacterium]
MKSLYSINILTISMLIVLGVISIANFIGCSEEETPSDEANGTFELPEAEPVEKEIMVLIPAGEFEMGDNFNEGWDTEHPMHTVYVDSFDIDVYEVTNEQYAEFLNSYGKNVDAAGHELLDINSNVCLIEKVGNTYKPKARYEKHPVIEVSWYGAAAFAQFYGKRLLTEAEWEKAARGGLVGKRYPWGDDISHNNANYLGTSGRDRWNGTSPVGSFPPNGYDLYDMAGNVWEWCADAYDESYYNESPKNNPKGPGVAVTFKNNDFTNVASRRVLRGGGWETYTSYYLRCAFRHHYVPTYTSGPLGFRCARDL